MDTIPQEVMQKILLSFDFDAWCRAIFVCRMWAKICTENNWKTNEFVRYKFRDMTSIDYLLEKRCSDYYEPYLPNGLRHGLGYHYFTSGHNIFEMELWVHGREVSTIQYNCRTQLSCRLNFTIDNAIIMFIFDIEYPVVFITTNKFRKIEL